ncbi:hypothetical protein C5F63_09565 [Photobacterium damselae subsp. damselae]|uniref:DUF2861 family protein n=1 Tax=Photobacterium damselae TaxID=38293 RepID=UPI000D07D5F7|nr:DUF2861 family protein [Photobacterium damselae]PSB87714.1 hypothetical protein C5F63_09565 [Photobacterium damselae subsp. damselae]
MKRLTASLCSLFLVGSAFCTPSASAKWFISKNLYTLANEKLLEGYTSESFDTIIQAWQQQPDAIHQANLNNLLDLAITDDCGHSLNKKVLPQWLSQLSVNREVIQNTNQLMLKLSITGLTRNKIKSISFSRWPDMDIIKGTPLIEEGGYFNIEARRLEKPIHAGLYRLSIQAEDEKPWNSWIVLAEPALKQQIGWVDNSHWRIEHNYFQNPSCPTPALTVDLFDLNNSSWTPVWSQRINNKDLPNELPEVSLPDGRYWLSVGLINSRWQGDIAIKDVQRITQPVDFPL